MADPQGINADLIDNTSQRLPCALVLDVSGSMSGKPVGALNEGLKLLEAELKSDPIASQRVRLLVICFGGTGGESEVDVAADWKDAMSFAAPVLTTGGLSPLGKAVDMAMAKTEEEKARYRATGIAYNRPWLFVLTDGEPTDANWEEVAARCRASESEGRFTFFGVGVGEANLEKLGKFTQRPPLRLEGLKFRELFVWLSQSSKTASIASRGNSVQMPPPASWAHIPG